MSLSVAGAASRPEDQSSDSAFSGNPWIIAHVSDLYKPY